MPTALTPYVCLVWFVLFLFAGMGWTLGARIISRLLG